MTEGILYEPRSLWSIANVDITDNAAPIRVRLPRKHFHNSERYPYQLRRIAICAVNFSFLEPLAYQEGSTQLHACQVQLAAPQRYFLNPKRFMVDTCIVPRPTWAPRENLVAAQQPSALWNQSMLKLDKPLHLPQRGVIEWDLSAHTPWRIDAQDFEDAEIFATMGFQEGPFPGTIDQTDPGLFAGSMRAKRVLLRAFDGTLTGNIPADSVEKWPYPPDANFAAGALATAFSTTDWWPGLQRFNGRDFRRQEATRSGSTQITDLRVAVDQRAYDAQMQTAFNTPNQPSPLSLRTGTRIRTVAAGTNAWWWRPGAPLALVFDHISPANVYELPEGFTLGHGDTLEVEMTMPAPFDGGEAPVQPSAYHIGIAVNGYAVIEG